MTFFHPQLLWLVLLPALLLGWEVVRARRKARDEGALPGGKILAVDAGAVSVRPSGGAVAVARARRGIRWCVCLGLACAVVALARPQWGKIEEPVFDQSREILIAVDLSRSMLAQDVKPSRLERSRLLVQSLLDALAGEQVGLVVFSGTAFLQAPLSSDYEILREFLPALEPGYLPRAGTNYAALLTVALDAFGADGADRFLIVLSDGEADPANPWRPLAEKCRERGIRAITLGVGTAAGTMIPGDDGGLLKDERGAVVLSKLEPATLRELAGLTAGTYADASAWIDLAALLSATVEQGKTGAFRETKKARLAERFQWALAPAVAFLLLGLWREFPVRVRSRRVTLAAGRTAVLLAGAVWLGGGDAFALVEKTEPSAPAATVGPGANLGALVSRLAAQGKMSSADAQALAEATQGYGADLRAQGRPVPSGPVNDALEAVRRAAQDNPSDADWDAIRERLEALKKTPPPPEQQSQDREKSSDEEKGDSRRQPGDAEKQNDPGKSEDQRSQNQDSADGQERGKGSGDSEPGKNNSAENQGKPGEPEASGKNDGRDSEQNNGAKKQQDNAAKNGESTLGKSGAKDGTSQEAAPPKPDGRGGQAFENMRDAPEERRRHADSAGAASPEQQPPDRPATRQVGGVATQGTPLDKNIDPKLLVPLQRLERVKETDMPGKLFQRMQEGGETAPKREGRTW